MASRPMIRPGSSNLKDPVERGIENLLIRRMRERRQLKGMGYPTGAQDAQIARTKQRLYG